MMTGWIFRYMMGDERYEQLLRTQDYLGQAANTVTETVNTAVSYASSAATTAKDSAVAAGNYVAGKLSEAATAASVYAPTVFAPAAPARDMSHDAIVERHEVRKGNSK